MHVYLALNVFFFSYVGLYGQLGLGTNSKQTLPVLVETLKNEKVYLICCGSFETVSNNVKFSLLLLHFVFCTYYTVYLPGLVLYVIIST